MEQKPWYKSKLVWLGIVQTLVGVATLLSDWLGAGDYSPASIASLVGGILTVVLRVWFTDTVIASRKHDSQ